MNEEHARLDGFNEPEVPEVPMSEWTDEELLREYSLALNQNSIGELDWEEVLPYEIECRSRGLLEY